MEQRHEDKCSDKYPPVKFEREADCEFDSRDELRRKAGALRVGTVVKVGDEYFERIDARRQRYGQRIAYYTEQPSLI